MNKKFFVTLWLASAMAQSVVMAGEPPSSQVYGGFQVRKGEIVSVKNQRILTATQGGVLQFAVSPDSKHIVFVAHRDKENPKALSVWIVNIGSKETKQVGKGLNIYNCCIVRLQRFREFYWPELVCGSGVRAILYA